MQDGEERDRGEVLLGAGTDSTLDGRGWGRVAHVSAFDVKMDPPLSRLPGAEVDLVSDFRAVLVEHVDGNEVAVSSLEALALLHAGDQRGQLLGKPPAAGIEDALVALMVIAEGCIVSFSIARQVRREAVMAEGHVHGVAFKLLPGLGFAIEGGGVGAKVRKVVRDAFVSEGGPRFDREGSAVAGYRHCVVSNEATEVPGYQSWGHKPLQEPDKSRFHRTL